MSVAKYTYNVQIILNSKAPYETKRLKIKFLVELNVEKAAEKHGKSNVKNFIFKKHPDSGRIHGMGQDAHLFLPYDSSPRADNRLECMHRPENQVNYHLEGKLIYALTMENGSHNLIPFSHTRMVLPQIFLSRAFNENWYTYVNNSLANTLGISTDIIQQFKDIFTIVRKNIENTPPEYYFG